VVNTAPGSYIHKKILHNEPDKLECLSVAGRPTILKVKPGRAGVGHLRVGSGLTLKHYKRSD
jgi:hypothetical protein